MKIKIIAFGTLTAFFTPFCRSENKITLYIKPYPATDNSAEQQRIAGKIKNPGHVAKKAIRATLDQSAFAGVFSLYAGYLGISNDSGQIIFPRMHSAPAVTLVISSKITPMMMIGKTIHHWEIQDNTETEIYSIERKQDKETGLFFWNTKKMPKPKDGIIAREAIVIFAKPKNLFVPEGATVTTNSEHLVLPDIYARKEFNPIDNALYVLNLKHFFGDVAIRYKVDQKGYASHLQY